MVIKVITYRSTLLTLKSDVICFDFPVEASECEPAHRFRAKFAHEILAVIERALVHFVLEHFIKMRHIAKTAVE